MWISITRENPKTQGMKKDEQKARPFGSQVLGYVSTL